MFSPYCKIFQIFMGQDISIFQAAVEAYSLLTVKMPTLIDVKLAFQHLNVSNNHVDYNVDDHVDNKFDN